MAKKSVFEVIVGNVGSVYHGGSFRKANQTYESYIESSKLSFGRASGEPVTMFKDGEPHLEYDPRFGPPKTWRDLRDWINAMRPEMLDKPAQFFAPTEDAEIESIHICHIEIETMYNVGCLLLSQVNDIKTPAASLTRTDNF